VLALVLCFSLMYTLRRPNNTHRFVYEQCLSLLAVSTAMVVAGMTSLLCFILMVFLDVNFSQISLLLSLVVFFSTLACVSYRKQIPFPVYTRLSKVASTLSFATRKSIYFRTFFFLIVCFVFMNIYFL